MFSNKLIKTGTDKLNVSNLMSIFPNLDLRISFSMFSKMTNQILITVLIMTRKLK